MPGISWMAFLDQENILYLLIGNSISSHTYILGHKITSRIYGKISFNTGMPLKGPSPHVHYNTYSQWENGLV